MRVRSEFEVPVAAYNVSGEYAHDLRRGRTRLGRRRRIVLETLTSIRRAGADMILTYHAKEVARWLREAH